MPAVYKIILRIYIPDQDTVIETGTDELLIILRKSYATDGSGMAFTHAQRSIADASSIPEVDRIAPCREISVIVAKVHAEHLFTCFKETNGICLSKIPLCDRFFLANGEYCCLIAANSETVYASVFFAVRGKSSFRSESQVKIERSRLALIAY